MTVYWLRVDNLVFRKLKRFLIFELFGVFEAQALCILKTNLFVAKYAIRGNDISLIANKIPPKNRLWWKCRLNNANAD